MHTPPQSRRGRDKAEIKCSNKLYINRHSFKLSSIFFVPGHGSANPAYLASHASGFGSLRYIFKYTKPSALSHQPSAIGKKLLTIGTVFQLPPFTFHLSQFTFHHSPFTIHLSPLSSPTYHCPCNLQPAPCNLPPAPCPPSHSALS